MSKPVILLDAGNLVGLSGSNAGDLLTWNGSEWVAQAGGAGTGTVTSVTAGAGLDGGTITTSGTISMPNVGTADSYGNVAQVPYITTDAQGRITAITLNNIAIDTAQVAGLDAALADKVPTTRTISTTGGQLTGGGALSSNLTLGLATAGTSGDYGSASSVPVIHTDAYGRVTSATSTAINIATSQVSGLDTALAAKALKATTISAGTGISVTGGGTLGDNNTIALASGVVTPSAKGTASKSAAITVDTYGRVTTLTDQDIAIAASQITSGALPLVRGGTGIDASGVSAGELLIGASGGGALAVQTISQDATLAADGKVTVQGLQTVPVSAAAPVNGQVLQYNGTNWTPGIIPNGGSGGGGRVFYFDFGNTTGITPNSQLPQSTTSTPSTSPSLLGIGYDVGSASVQSANLSNGSYSRVAGFVTIPNTPGVTNIPAGLWDFNIWASATAGTNTQVQMQARVYIVSGDGTKYGSASGSNDHAALASSDPVFIYDQDTTAQYIVNVTMPQTTILATDRIYIELWAQKNVSQTRYIYFYFDSLHPSHVHTTLPSVAGTGLVHVIDGVFQSPASPADLASSDVTGTLPVANGGTGAATLPIHQVLLGNGTSAVTSVALGAGQVLIGTTSNDPAAATITSGTGVTVSSSSGAISIAIGQAVATSSAVTFANITDSGLTASQYVKTDSSKQLVSSATIAAGDLSGTVAVAHGGTGVASLTSNALLVGGSTVGALSGTASGQVATWSGTAWTATAPATSGTVTSVSSSTTMSGLTLATANGTTTPAITLSGTLGVTSGGTNITSYAVGDLLYADTTTSLAKLADVATGSALISGGVSTAPSWGKIGLTTHISGTLAVGNGGTGATTLTQYGVLVGNGTSTVAVTAAGTTSQYLKSGAGSANPSFATIQASEVNGLSGTYAPLASPTFTGTPSLPTGTTGVTQSAGNSTTALATTAFVAAAVTAASSAPYDLPAEIPGTPAVSTKVVNFKAVRAFTLASTGHQGGQLTNPSADVVCTIKKNGASITSTITFGASGTFSSSVTQTSFAVGDVLTVETPSAVNGIDTPYFTLVMTLA
jgi:hypothetical protein